MPLPECTGRRTLAQVTSLMLSWRTLQEANIPRMQCLRGMSVQDWTCATRCNATKRQGATKQVSWASLSWQLRPQVPRSVVCGVHVPSMADIHCPYGMRDLCPTLIGGVTGAGQLIWNKKFHDTYAQWQTCHSPSSGSLRSSPSYLDMSNGYVKMRIWAEFLTLQSPCDKISCRLCIRCFARCFAQELRQARSKSQLIFPHTLQAQQFASSTFWR